MQQLLIQQICTDDTYQKLDVYILDINKLKNTPVGLSILRDVAKLEVLKRTVYGKLVKKLILLRQIILAT